MAFREIPVMELEMLGKLGQGVTAVVRHARWWHGDGEEDGAPVRPGGSSRSLAERAGEGEGEGEADVEERAMTEVAVKEFTAASPSARPPAQVKAFMRELAALHRVPPHPNLVQVLGACTHPQLRLVIEYMPFGDLFGAIRSSAPPEFLVRPDEGAGGGQRVGGLGGVALTLATRVRLALDVASGLAHLHSCGRVHRDLKCHNILLDVADSQLRAKLGDFGTTLGVEEWRSDAASKRAGTRGYVAPELLVAGDAAATTPGGAEDSGPSPEVVASRSVAVDVFALGVVLWELVAEDPVWGNPLKDVPDDALVSRLRAGESPPLSPRVPAPYRDLVRRCWSFHAADRPSATTAVATLRDLADKLQDSG